MSSRNIFVTESDMRRLAQLIESFRGSHRDRDELGRLEQELDRAQVVPADQMPPDVVTMNSRVRVRDLRTGKEVVYQVVFPRDADASRNMISVLAPIGTALLGYQVGSEIEWDTPGGVRHLRVEAIESRPELAKTAA